MTYGIENLKKVPDFGASLAMAYTKAEADGKVTFADLPHVIQPAIDFVQLVFALKKVGRELADLTVEEKDSLTQYAVEKFSLENKVAEELVEATFGFVLNGVALIHQWQQGLKK